LAFAALINPDMIDTNAGKGYIPYIYLSNEERSNVYLMGLMVASIQIVTLIAIINFFTITEPIVLKPAQTVLVIIPRLLSSLMMHFNVEPDLR